MELLENDYEQKLLMDLPPNARDLAQEMLSTRSLGDLLLLRENAEPDKEILASKHVLERYWSDLINATILAKTTYFLPNSKFSQDEVFFLIKVAASTVNYPIEQTSLKEFIEFAKAKDMLILANWLEDLSDLLVQ